MIRDCRAADIGAVLAVVNDAAEAYRGVIPEDCWHDPYMTRAALEAEIAAGVRFRGWDTGALAGVMGLQEVGDVALIRHAYVRTGNQRQGIGAGLLADLRRRTTRPLLVGTWAAADWAIRFYQRRGFGVVPSPTGAALLRRYWSIPERQIATSVVLAERAAAELRPTPMPSPGRSGPGSPR